MYRSSSSKEKKSQGAQTGPVDLSKSAVVAVTQRPSASLTKSSRMPLKKRPVRLSSDEPSSYTVDDLPMTQLQRQVASYWLMLQTNSSTKELSEGGFPSPSSGSYLYSEHYRTIKSGGNLIDCPASDSRKSAPTADPKALALVAADNGRVEVAATSDPTHKKHGNDEEEDDEIELEKLTMTVATKNGSFLGPTVTPSPHPAPTEAHSVSEAALPKNPTNLPPFAIKPTPNFAMFAHLGGREVEFKKVINARRPVGALNTETNSSFRKTAPGSLPKPYFATSPQDTMTKSPVAIHPGIASIFTTSPLTDAAKTMDDLNLNWDSPGKEKSPWTYNPSPTTPAPTMPNFSPLKRSGPKRSSAFASSDGMTVSQRHRMLLMRRASQNKET